MRDLDGPIQATWVAGEDAKVVFGITANHGGGYSFRLCPASELLTESCFQANALKFANSSSWILNREGEPIKRIQATRTTNGTFPLGSEWTKNPIPSEANFFEPPIPGLFGPGPFPESSIMDYVHVPSDLPPGRYTLSFRWDAEATKQVWSGCSDIAIISQGYHLYDSEQRDGGEIVKDAGETPHGPNHHVNVCTGSSMGLDVNQCDAWVDFYDSLGGPGWDDCAENRLDPCGCSQKHWGRTVFCSQSQNYQQITEIYLLNNSLTGTLPPSISEFSSLHAMDLNHNNIRGSIPETIGSLSNLEALWLHHNGELSGVLPASMQNLSFYALELHNCNISGVLPNIEFWSISNCLLYGNSFDCPVPDQANSCGATCRNESG